MNFNQSPNNQSPNSYSWSFEGFDRTESGDSIDNYSSRSYCNNSGYEPKTFSLDPKDAGYLARKMAHAMVTPPQKQLYSYVISPGSPYSPASGFSANSCGNYGAYTSSHCSSFRGTSPP